MTPRTIKLWNVLIAIFVLLLGLFVMWHSTSYRIGTFARMGGGFYPLLLGGVLSVLAIVNLLTTWRLASDPFSFRIVPVIWIGAALIAFAMLLRPFGLVPATVAMVLIASRADSDSTPMTVIGTAIGLSLIGVFVFIYGLKVSLPVISW